MVCTPLSPSSSTLCSEKSLVCLLQIPRATFPYMAGDSCHEWDVQLVSLSLLGAVAWSIKLLLWLVPSNGLTVREECTNKTARQVQHDTITNLPLCIPWLANPSRLRDGLERYGELLLLLPDTPGQWTWFAVSSSLTIANEMSRRSGSELRGDHPHGNHDPARLLQDNLDWVNPLSPTPKCHHRKSTRDGPAQFGR